MVAVTATHEFKGIENNTKEYHPIKEDNALKLGDNSNKVTDLQLILKGNGYYNGTIDGKFGDSTEEAVKKLQNDANLKTDGQVGSETSSVLKELTKFSENKPSINKDRGNYYLYC